MPENEKSSKAQQIVQIINNFTRKLKKKGDDKIKGLVKSKR
jgi:hypothetical protein